MRLTVRVGESYQRIMAEQMRNLTCTKAQVDERRTSCPKKQARLSYEERNAVGLGDQWVFFAIDADTRLVPPLRSGSGTW